LSPRPRNAQQEAFDRLGGRYDVRVLEPSPPAVTDPPWFADDPVRPGDRSGSSRELVSPVTTGDLLWEDVASDDPELERFCRERWLGPYRRLEKVGEALSGALEETRISLHRLAEHVISPTRQRANGKIGLRFTLGGFGTPFFGNDVQLRVAGDVLTVQMGRRAQEGRLTTLKDAAEFIGFDLTRFDEALQEEPLAVDVEASRLLGDWFGFAASVLERLRADSAPAHEPSRVQLWPEHFDVSVELGSESAGRRAAYGCSPGDERHAEPYLYVAPWGATPAGELWRAEGFSGAELPYGALVEAEDQRGAALEFFGARLADLHAG
jgi:hypothetical protein